MPYAVDLSPLPPPKPTVRFRRVAAVVNPAAGGVHPDAAERLAVALHRLGATHIEVAACSGAELENVLAPRLRSDVDALVVLGGDGTARRAAELAKADSPPLLLLPGGTLNMLPYALHGQCGWREALEAALKTGVVRPLSAGRANGAAFFVAAVFGEPTRLAQAREALRAGRPLTGMRLLLNSVRRCFSRGLRVQADQGPRYRSEALAVLCPAFDGRFEPDGGLEWVQLDPRNGVEAARLGLAALFDRWRQDPSVQARACGRAEVRAFAGLVPAILDGEPTLLRSPVSITLDPAAARVIVPERPRAA